MWYYILLNILLYPLYCEFHKVLIIADTETLDYSHYLYTITRNHSYCLHVKYQRVNNFWAKSSLLFSEKVTSLCVSLSHSWPPTPRAHTHALLNFHIIFYAAVPLSEWSSCIQWMGGGAGELSYQLWPDFEVQPAANELNSLKVG